MPEGTPTHVRTIRIGRRDVRAKTVADDVHVDPRRNHFASQYAINCRDEANRLQAAGVVRPASLDGAQEGSPGGGRGSHGLVLQAEARRSSRDNTYRFPA